ncbi:MAG TPA: sialic acid TRAP transporter substrate-binding protein SiaP [Myxococcaceae bacterium]|nr:sialic acid TRAP transporter substrate-binding protein SiaP [Myxococcaceae bacterium]
MSRRFLNVVVAAQLLLVGAGDALAQQKLKFAHVYETSEPYHKWAVWAAQELPKRTENRYTMEVFPASTLGKETDINQGLTLGTVDIIYTGTAFAARSYGPVGIATAPYMLRDYDHWQKYHHSDLFKELAEGYRKATQHKIVAALYYGQRHVTSNKPIHKPADMVGLKIRVPDAPQYLMFPKSVGANATPIAFAEVYLALQQGTVDAQENPLPTIYAKKFYEVQKYINLTGHVTETLFTIVGGPLWNRLSEQDKKTFEQLFQEAAGKCNEEIVAQEKSLVGQFEKLGNIVNRDVDRAAFREAAVKVNLGPDAKWTKQQYDRLQAIK